MSVKRPRGADDDEDMKLRELLKASEEYVPYVPLKQRGKAGRISHADDGNGREEHKVKVDVPENDHHHDDDDEEDLRKALRSDDEDDDHHAKGSSSAAVDTKKSLLDVTEEMKKRRERMDPTMIKLELQKQQEQRILGEVRGEC